MTMVRPPLLKGHRSRIAKFGGLVAQLVEQRPFKPFVQGSSPCQPTIYLVASPTSPLVSRSVSSLTLSFCFAYTFSLYPELS